MPTKHVSVREHDRRKPHQDDTTHVDHYVRQQEVSSRPAASAQELGPLNDRERKIRELMELHHVERSWAEKYVDGQLPHQQPDKLAGLESVKDLMGTNHAFAKIWADVVEMGHDPYDYNVKQESFNYNSSKVSDKELQEAVLEEVFKAAKESFEDEIADAGFDSEYPDRGVEIHGQMFKDNGDGIVDVCHITRQFNNTDEYAEAMVERGLMKEDEDVMAFIQKEHSRRSSDAS